VKYNLSNVVDKYLRPIDPDAALWLMGFYVYCHTIDDIIDKEPHGGKVVAQMVVENALHAEAIFSNHWYLQNVHALRPLVRMAARAYQDSLHWQDSPDEIKKRISDNLRSLGNEMALAVVELVCGPEARAEVALEFRETCYKEQH
jgi:hypothetical protein